jgi:hypothetical protein
MLINEIVTCSFETVLTLASMCFVVVVYRGYFVVVVSRYVLHLVPF